MANSEARKKLRLSSRQHMHMLLSSRICALQQSGMANLKFRPRWRLEDYDLDVWACHTMAPYPRLTRARPTCEKSLCSYTDLISSPWRVVPPTAHIASETSHSFHRAIPGMYVLDITVADRGEPGVSRRWRSGNCGTHAYFNEGCSSE